MVSNRRNSILAVRTCAAISLALLLAACRQGPMDASKAEQELSRLVQRVNPSDAPLGAAATGEAAPSRSVADTLPDIRKYPIVVESGEAGAVVAEIFSSTEKSGTGTDGALVEIARAFNDKGSRLADGKVAQVRIRSIPSGTAYEYIAYGKYLPDGFTPSNELWIQMVKAAGVPVSSVSARLVRNTAGIVMKDAVYDRLAKKYGTVDLPGIINAVADGSLAMGYTNPFASSTGLNFLVTVLESFAKGDQTKLLSPEVVSAFEAFQKGVPFVSLTTMQMRDSVAKGGSLDAFIMEYQTFANTQVLKSGYRFIPFGFPHDNPLYAIGNPDADTRAVLELFAAYVRSGPGLATAQRYGFEKDLSWQPLTALPPGDLLVRAQALWKEKKDLGRPVVAVFLSDVSGSMDGARIKALKEALTKGSAFIDPRNYIGLASFSTGVTRIVPVKQFSENQKALFLSAVSEMTAGGNTAMYDGIVVALQMLEDAMKQVPNAKPLLFVLTDGETNRGLTFDGVSRVIEGTGIPVYTIGYGEDISALTRLSSLNEAASLRADPLDIAYQIGALLNAEM
jgi:Ca-activated chloride channel family protein